MIDQDAFKFELIELTAFDRDCCVVAFASDANDVERARAERLPLARARIFVHAHGALRMLPAARHRSVSYAGGRAWVVLADAPVGLDVVFAPDDHPLDPTFVMREERDAVASLGFPPVLAVWATKEATAKLFGDVDRAPNDWHLRKVGVDWHVDGNARQNAQIDFVRLSNDLLASLAWLR